MVPWPPSLNSPGLPGADDRRDFSAIRVGPRLARLNCSPEAESDQRPFLLLLVNRAGFNGLPLGICALGRDGPHLAINGHDRGLGGRDFSTLLVDQLYR